jgi:mRNA-degrading endonuclease RelE of RelBE toxin-antitoxin system
MTITGKTDLYARICERPEVKSCGLLSFNHSLRTGDWRIVFIIDDTARTVGVTRVPPARGL